MPLDLTSRRICGAAVRLPLSLVGRALSLDPAVATLADVTQTPGCLLEEHTSGAHHGLVMDLDGPATGAVWAVWTPDSVELVVLPDCPGLDGKGGCCGHGRHPGLHTDQLYDPPAGNAGSVLAGITRP